MLLRIRPPLEHETAMGTGQYRKALSVDNESAEIEGKRFTFDDAVDEKCTQAEVFERVGKPLTECCIDGVNSTLFAYGQTGSGKTYTMVGKTDCEANLGLVPRVFDHLFTRITEKQDEHAESGLTFKCKCAFLEIYNETITDLLSDSADVKIRQKKSGEVFLDGAAEMPVSDAEQTFGILQRGSKVHALPSMLRGAAPFACRSRCAENFP